MVIFNAMGAGIALLAVFVMIIVDKLTPRTMDGDWQLVVFVLLLMAPDLVLRFRQRRVEGWKALGLPTCGGHFFFIPMWVWGIVALVVGVL